ncbi:tyrosine-type recombinase/integrase [Streptomyces seoulensis]
MGTVCEFLSFGVRMQWVDAELAGQLTEPRYLRYLPKGFNPGENGQHRTVRTRLLRLRGVDAGIEWLTVEQIARLVEVTRYARDRFLVLLLWCTGMRIGEALGLRREDMHLLSDSQAFGCQVKGPHVHVRRRLNSNGAWAKSRKPRAIPVTSKLGICYADYLHERSAVAQADVTEQVLVNLFREPLGQAMTYSGVKGLFDRLARRAEPLRV